MKDYSYIELDRERNSLEKDMSSLLSQVFKRSRGADAALVREVLEDVDTMIKRLQDAFASPKKEELLGGEFNKDSIYVGSEMKKDKTSIPLYFELDMLIATLEKDYVKKFSDPKDIIQMLESLNQLREEATHLNFNSAFQPNEPMSAAAMDDILATNGNFEVGKYEKYGMKFVGIKPILISEGITYSHGDYSSDGVSFTSLGQKPLYEKDAQEFAKIRTQNLNHLHDVVGKYFENSLDFIPKSDKFFDKLVDINIDERLKRQLLEVCYIKDKQPDNYEVAAMAAPILEEIVKIENQIQKEQEAVQARRNAIHDARARYQEKSGFWKFFHRKMDPNNLNLDAMSTEEIDGLYRGKAK